ncbi:MAG: hypothetical protein M3376_07090 [Actinomycetota bacterium]|nr:hypothetical protein [Actinomycetota bacterium]
MAALSADELPGLLRFLATARALPFHFISLHAPSKGRRLREKQLVAMLLGVVRSIDAVVVHPDTIDEPQRYAALGSALVLGNLDSRKHDGRTVAELEPYFAALPQAGFCLTPHAASVDDELAEGERLLDCFGARLRHLRLSSLDADCHHVPLTAGDEERFGALLRRCRDVPWILEAPLREGRSGAPRARSSAWRRTARRAFPAARGTRADGPPAWRDAREGRLDRAARGRLDRAVRLLGAS